MCVCGTPFFAWVGWVVLRCRSPKRSVVVVCRFVLVFVSIGVCGEVFFFRREAEESGKLLIMISWPGGTTQGRARHSHVRNFNTQGQGQVPYTLCSLLCFNTYILLSLPSDFCCFWWNVAQLKKVNNNIWKFSIIHVII